MRFRLFSLVPELLLRRDPEAVHQAFEGFPLSGFDQDGSVRGHVPERDLDLFLPLDQLSLFDSGFRGIDLFSPAVGLEQVRDPFCRFGKLFRERICQY